MRVYVRTVCGAEGWPRVQVHELQSELRAALAAQEAAGQRAEEKVEEERGRAARALRQRTDELEWRSTEREAEAEAALTRAEKLRQAATECEAAATRKVRGPGVGRPRSAASPPTPTGPCLAGRGTLCVNSCVS